MEYNLINFINLFFKNSTNYVTDEFRPNEFETYKVLKASKDNNDILMTLFYNDEELETLIYGSVKWQSKNLSYCWKNDDYEHITFTSHDDIELDVFEDFAEKATAILNRDETFDRRVIMSFEASESEIEMFKHAASLEGLTLEEFMEKIIHEIADSYKYEKSQEVT